MSIIGSITTATPKGMRRYYIFFTVLFAVAVVAIITQFKLSKGPRIDEQTVKDISTIQSAVEKYARSNNRLPATLNDIPLKDEVKKRAIDQEYTYAKSSSNKYKICAFFYTDARDDDEEDSPSVYYDDDDYRSAYSHKKGTDCFSYTSYSIRSTNRFDYDY